MERQGEVNPDKIAKKVVKARSGNLGGSFYIDQSGAIRNLKVMRWLRVGDLVLHMHALGVCKELVQVFPPDSSFADALHDLVLSFILSVNHSLMGDIRNSAQDRDSFLLKVRNSALLGRHPIPKLPGLCDEVLSFLRRLAFRDPLGDFVPLSLKFAELSPALPPGSI
jgi:hypothetical protein